jgi:8-oxo-dGTP diphosphatase
MSPYNKPTVGIGIIIENDKGEILVGKRIGKHAPWYSIFGGGLEAGESFEQAAIREAAEELGITIHKVDVFALTNNLDTFKQEGHHSISVIVRAISYSGKPNIMEPDKCSEILWCDPRSLPEPHYDASRLGVRCYLENKFYVGLSN